VENGERVRSPPRALLHATIHLYATYVKTMSTSESVMSRISLFWDLLVSAASFWHSGRHYLQARPAASLWSLSLARATHMYALLASGLDDNQRSSTVYLQEYR